MKPALQRRVQRYGWDKAADYYEQSWKEQLKPAQDKLLDMLDLKTGENVLETACGTGLVTFEIAHQIEPGGKLVATDISDGMIQKAKTISEKRKVNNISFQRMDAEKLDLENNSFDAAACALGLMYVPDPVESLKEMHRVLKAGGRAGVAIWGERKNCGWAEIFPIVDKRVASDVCPLFFLQGTGNVLESSFKKAGFSIIKTERISVTLHYPNAEKAVIAAFAGGAVALAYQKFDGSTKEEAHREYMDSIAGFKKSSGYEIPGEFVIATGEKPE